MYQPKIQIYQKTNGSVAYFRLFVLSKLTVTFLKNETYGYGSQYNLKKPLVSVSYSNLVWNLALFDLAKQKLQIKYGFDLIKWHTKYQRPFLEFSLIWVCVK